MSADLIVTNGSVLTMNELQPRADAIAIAGNEIVFVGTAQEAKGLSSSKTRVIDAQGGTVMPGFIEGHMHLFGGAADLKQLDLFGTRGFEMLAASRRMPPAIPAKG